MIEKVLYLKGTDPIVFYGQNNINIEILKHFFPKLKIIARGDKVKAIGNPDEIELFEEKLKRIFSHVNQFNQLDQYSLEGILGESLPQGNIGRSKDDDIIVFGNSGKREGLPDGIGGRCQRQRNRTGCKNGNGSFQL